ncbi:MAG: queuine tRNA-ribosyltransferase family protein, partial [Bacteroidales bacterium]|nr:queuine tRNA-ribosyltransferase family protein [Bacteroidales bacterium]
IIMAFDECTPYPCEYDYARKSMILTHEWLDRGKQRFLDTGPEYGYSQSWFPIVQGSTFPDLRKESAMRITEADMEGNAIGGLSVGEPADMMYEMIDIVTGILPPDRPRYLMGVGTPVNLLESISMGIDMFDCVMPTRNGRNGQLFTREGIINIKNEKWKDDFTPVDPSGDCFADQQYSRAYLRHLIISGEILGAQIASLHNLRFYLWLMEEARRQIQTGTFHNWKNEMISRISIRL